MEAGTDIAALGPRHQIGYSEAKPNCRGMYGFRGMVAPGELPQVRKNRGRASRPATIEWCREDGPVFAFAGLPSAASNQLLPRFTRTSAVFLKQGTIDNMRRQIEEGEEPRHENGGGLLRKLISVQGSGGNTTKGLENRMKFSDAEIMPEVMG